MHKSEVHPFVPLTDDYQTAELTQAPQTHYGTVLKYFGVRLCVVVTLGVMLLGAVELYSYYRYPAGNDVLEPAAKLDLAAQGSPANTEFWKEFQQSDKVVYHQYVLWRRAPYQGELISVDEEGIRRTLHTRCDDQTFTIWVFGDSVMWGAAVPNTDTIPSLIAQEYENAGKPVCIVNYAEKGWSNTQETIELMEQLKSKRRPDIVLFYDGGTEAFAAYQSGRADVHTNFAMFKTFLENWRKTQRPNFSFLRQTNTYRLLQRIAARISSHQKSEPEPATSLDVETLSAAVVQNYEHNMDIVDLLAKQYGFRAVFAWYPNLAVGHKSMTPAEQRLEHSVYHEFPGLGSIYQAVYKKGEEIKRNNFYTLADAVDDRQDTLYVGISHMNSEGNQIISERLFHLLEDSKFPAQASGRPDK
jgi:hypothetical protein